MKHQMPIFRLHIQSGGIKTFHSRHHGQKIYGRHYPDFPEARTEVSIKEHSAVIEGYFKKMMNEDEQKRDENPGLIPH